MPISNQTRSMGSELPQGRLDAEVRSSCVSVRLAKYQTGWSVLQLYTHDAHTHFSYGFKWKTGGGEGVVSLKSLVKQGHL